MVSWLVLSRWSIGAYGAIVDVSAMVPEIPKVPSSTAPLLPFDPSPIDDLT